MSRNIRRIAVASLVVIALVAVFGLRFRQLGAQQALASIRSEHERLGVPVETVTAGRGELARWTELAGTVQGATQYAVVSNNALRVVGIPVREGMTVSEGDVVLRLADEAPNPMFHSVARSRANHANLQRDVQRLRNLYAEGAVSRQELDNAETSLRVAESDLADAEGSTVLRASEAGVVVSILAEEGDTVEPNKPLVWIADTREVEIEFEAGSNQAQQLTVGQPAVFTGPDGYESVGRVTRLDLMADPQTHLLSGKVTFGNPDGRLVPGLLVSFRVQTVRREDVLTVPAAALSEFEGSPSLWVVSGTDDERTASLRAVTPGLRTTDRVEIAQGLEDGAVVVLHGGSLLTDGVKVNDVTGPGGE